MPRSGIREIMDQVWSMHQPIIPLHVGEPSFVPPAHVLEAARAAYASGDTHYVPNAGTAPLRQAAAEKITRLNHFATGPDQVIIAAGAAQALHLALSMTISAGDEVLIPDPGWPNYEMAIQLLQAVPVRYPLHATNEFLPDLDELASLVTERTRVLLVNTPSNPLGTVLSASDVEGLVRLAKRFDIWLLSDECYDALTFDVEHISPGRFDDDDRVLSAFSFSKTFAMTGLRVGYLAVPSRIAGEAAKLQEPLVSCVNAPAQAAATAALTGPQDAVLEMRNIYRERRDQAIGLLEDRSVPHLRPDGTFYLWIDVSLQSEGDVQGWALSLLRNQLVAVAPGSAFGSVGEGWARVSLATDTKILLEGISRICDAQPR